MSSIPVWELVEMTKRFAGITANDRISLKLYAGEIHGLLGVNGCGKSTLIKMLSGAHQPTSGTILRNGKKIVLSNPIAAREAGVATVFQEFSVVPTLSVAENIHLGRLPRRRGQVDWPAMRENARRALSAMDVDIDVDAPVHTLSVAEQQLVEIAKALAADASMIILDEPTTALGIDEIERLHAILKRLKAQGRSILYISHRLDEVVSLVDKVTILRDGRVVSSAEESEISISYIVETMVGEVGEHYPKQRNGTAEVMLAVENIATGNRVRGVAFDVHRGEVFGLGGVLGSGRTEVARALFGIDRLTRGRIRLCGREIPLGKPQDAIRAGIALVPENRKSDGLFFNFAGFANLTIANLARIGPSGVLSLKREADEGRNLIRDLEITPAAEVKTVGFLSGGNQQKIVIGRWLFADADIFLFDEPTQGIDVGAKIAVYKLINRLTAAGKSVILISSDHEELLAMSDRVGIMSHGRLVSIHDARDLDVSALVQASAGAPASEHPVGETI